MTFSSDKNVYISFEDDFLNDFFKPNLSKASEYKRISGYFSSRFIDLIYDETISAATENDLKIKIICSPNLSSEDQLKIKKGYDYKKIIEENISQSVENISRKTEKMEYVSELIMKGVLDIKFAVNSRGGGLFHAKIGILKDKKGQKIGFNGSNNETLAAVIDNFEITNIITEDLVIEKYDEVFNDLWADRHNEVHTYEPTGDLLENINEIVKRNSKRNEKKTFLDEITLYPYQKEALKNWKNNNFKGMLEMATGTGKTITALACHDELLKRVNNLITFIIVPQLDLLSQWSDEIKTLGIRVVKCSSGNKNWIKELKLNLFNEEEPLFVMVTTDTFKESKMQNIIKKNLNREALIIADEVHSFGSEKTRATYEMVKKKFNYLLGVSATPFRKNEKETDELITLFDGIIFSYNLNDAIENGYLNRYLYHPYVLSFSNSELHSYRREVKESYNKANNIVKAIENVTSTIVNSSTGKINALEELIEDNGVKNPKIIYCSPGNYNNGYVSYDERHIDHVSKRIGGMGCKLRKVNSEVPIDTRYEILEQFKEGDLDTLVAVKCLDQGVNLKTVTHAYILSSTDSPTEFIQRRGRILRVHKDKPVSEIFDLIMLPEDIHDPFTEPKDEDAYLVMRELRRFNEYNSAAENKNENQRIIDKINDVYGEVIEKYEQQQF